MEVFTLCSRDNNSPNYGVRLMLLWDSHLPYQIRRDPSLYNVTIRSGKSPALLTLPPGPDNITTQNLLPPTP